MRKPLVIALVLMGGGAAAATGYTMYTDSARRRECEMAREQNLPNMAEICARSARSSSSSSSSTSTSRGYYGSGGRTSWWSSGSSSSSGGTALAGGGTASTSTVSRGGFGFTGSSHSSSGS